VYLWNENQCESAMDEDADENAADTGDSASAT